MSFRIVDRPLADAIAERRPDGPRWVVAPAAESEIGCAWARRALLAVPMFQPILPPGEVHIEDFRGHRTTAREPLLDPAIAPTIAGHLDRLSGATGRGYFVLGGSPRFDLWLIDFLPRCWLLTREARLRSMPMLVNGPFTAMQQETLRFALDALGLAPPPIEPVAGSGFVGLIDPCLPTRVWRIAAVEFWRRVIERTRHELIAPPRRRLFVVERHADQRGLRDADALAARLAGHGFETIDMAGMPFVDQVELFAAARIVVGVHGPGLANVVFARSGLTLIELRSTDDPRTFGALAALRKQRHVDVPVTVDGRPRPGAPRGERVLSPEGERALIDAIAQAG